MIRPYLAFYSFWLTLPNRFFPFSCKINGRRVRGKRAYEHILKRIQKKRGPGSYSYTLILYRQVFHVLGAILFILLAAYLSKTYLGGDAALYALLGAMVFLITVQEFYFHPRYFHQHVPKSVSDWLAWVVPVGMYVFVL